MRTDWKTYFAFSKKERTAATVLIILIVIFFVAPFFYHPARDEIKISTLEQEIAKQNLDTDSASNADELFAYAPSDENEIVNPTPVRLFTFDPNTLNAAGFKQLGLPEKTIGTIIKYRSKGGHFWKADDLRKIYSLRKEDADRLIPYIQIAGQQQSFVNTAGLHQATTKSSAKVLDINTATLEQWKALPAIGDVLANRIIKFRDKTGGFTSIAQLKQTYGLSDSAYKVIEPYLTLRSAPALQKDNEPEKEKININTATLNKLKNNEHISPEVAQAIVIYRSQHGNFSSAEELKKIVFIDEEMFRQIAPYITVE